MAAKTATELFNEMAKKAGFTADQVTLALSQPEYKELENGFVRHDEYSSALDKAKNLQGQADKAKQWDDWYKQNSPAITGLNEKAQLLAKYEERFGALDGSAGDTRAAAATTGLTMADVTKITEQLSQNFSGLLKDGLRIASRHAAAFGEELDVDALEKIALEKRVPLTQAYEELVAPRVRERNEAKTKVEIEKQVSERVKDELSRRAMSPGTSGHSAPPVFIGQQPTGADAPKPLGDQDLMSLWSDAGKTAAA